jgi:hypothetical protein
LRGGTALTFCRFARIPLGQIDRRDVPFKPLYEPNRVGSMAKTKSAIPNSLQPWIEARRRFRLSHAEVQMARELGMNPKRLGGLDDHHQERWKQPLPQFIATLYAQRLGKDAPDLVRSIEEMIAIKRAKKQLRAAEQQAATIVYAD